MWTRKLLKQNGKIAFKRNYWACVAVCLIAMLLGGISGGSIDLNTGNNSLININNNNDITIDGIESFNEYSGMYDVEDTLEALFASIPGYVWTIAGVAVLIGAIIGIALRILVSNVMAVGCSRYFIENRDHKTSVGQVFYSFKNGRYGSTVLVMFFRELYVFLWTLLFIIPGIIKSYAYTLVPYIMAENTELDRKRALEMSRDMMKGHKWELFVLQFSFIGWHILGAITLGILNVFYVNPYMQATLAEFYSAVKAEAIQKGIVYQGELPGVSIVVEPEYEEVVVE